MYTLYIHDSCKLKQFFFPLCKGGHCYTVQYLFGHFTIYLLLQLFSEFLTLYLPHFESQYLVHLQILIKIAQETLSFHTYMV